MKEGPAVLGEPCPECMGDDWIITATMISCRACGSMWGRVNGQWIGPVSQDKIVYARELISRPYTTLDLIVYALGKEKAEDGE
jgi:hypothetical protein